MAELGIRNRELVLPPGTYAHVLDNTKGKVEVYVGPVKNSLSETDQPVIWNSAKQRYENVDSTEAATRTFSLAEQGQYIVLTNPSHDGKHPQKGAATEAPELDNGRRVIVPGPATFPLWPGQTADTIDGHHLRHNQFVIVRVYDPVAARENWQQTVMAPQVPSVPADPETLLEHANISPEAFEAMAQEDRDALLDRLRGEQATPSVPVPLASEAPEFTMGQLMVIEGTQVSFYMPSTGMEVVTEGDQNQVGDARNFSPVPNSQYVRNAVTLETLEYCILLDEAGTKRYVRGPQVVFPTPTETFKVNENGSRVFDAIELNEQSGIYVKVIEAYDDRPSTGEVIHHPVGEELFITGNEQAIYFPRAEHSLITYDNKRKHHAIAVPAGEGRYVLDRTSGDVELREGPTMLLPDPRTEVIVRRILDPHDVEVMYPGNQEALTVNLGYAQQRAQSAADYLENSEVRKSLRGDKGQRAAFAGNETPLASYASAGESFLGDAISRGTQYTPPRTITLDTKYEGAVAVGIWPGYAVLVSDKTGNRHVEVGPKVVLLKYDETIMALNLSRGRPKSDENKLRTGYLRVVNNHVTDRVTVETRDLVSIDIDVSYRVNFEGTTSEDQQKWFGVENYVQILTDNCRSRLRNIAKRSAVLDFYTNVIDIVRDTILGAISEEGERTGLFFDENNMRVYDVEVLSTTINDTNIRTLLTGAQNKALTGAIELTVAEEEATRTHRLEQLKRDSMKEKQDTAETEATIALAQVRAEMDNRLARVATEIAIEADQQKVISKKLETSKMQEAQEHEMQEESDRIEIARMEAEVEVFVKRMQSMQPGLIEALTAFSDDVIAERIATAMGPAALAAGLTTGDMLQKVFTGTALEPFTAALARRPMAVSANSH